MIYAILGALLVGGSLGLLGSGGSILTVPILVYFLQHEDKVAIAESLGIVGAIALAGVIPYACERLVEWRTALLIGIPGMLGTLAGAWIATAVPGFVQLIVFALVMLIAAWFMWKRSRKPAPAEPADTPVPRRASWLILLQGAALGVLTGFVGVGGGFLIVPTLVLLAGLPMRRAVATSLAVIVMNCATGFLKYLHHFSDAGLSVNWTTIGVFIAFGALGTFAGRRLGGRIPQRTLQQGFAVFLVAMAGFILVEETLLRPHDTPAASEPSPSP